MAQGFIIVRLDDTGTIDGYWDGTDFVEEQDSSEFIEEKGAARYAQGSNQSQITNQDIAIREAENKITLL